MTCEASGSENQILGFFFVLFVVSMSFGERTGKV